MRLMWIPQRASGVVAEAQPLDPRGGAFRMNVERPTPNVER